MEEKSNVTLKKIQEAAMAEFLDKGFQGASLRQIVKNAGVTTGAFYGYFSSKEALFASLVEPHAAALMGNTLFGGSSNSKLFLNVRERLSLCYYASSSYARSKNILTVSSGVETADFERAEAEIGRQLQAVQQGDWEDWEQEGALQAIRASLLSLSDSQGALENFYLGQIAAGVEETPEELAAALEQVTKERIVAAAQTVKPDTVYFLRGKEEA